MALALKLLKAPNGEDNTQRRTVIQGTAVFTGSYTAGGEAVNWLTITNFEGGTALINSLSTAPVWVEFVQTAPATTSPLWYWLVYNYTTNKVQVIVTGTAAAGGAELAATTYPAQMTGAGVAFQFLAEFPNEA